MQPTSILNQDHGFASTSSSEEVLECMARWVAVAVGQKREEIGGSPEAHSGDDSLSSTQGQSHHQAAGDDVVHKDIDG